MPTPMSPFSQTYQLVMDPDGQGEARKIEFEASGADAALYGGLSLATKTQELEARAQWCRRLARDAADDQLRTSLIEMAAELEGRARGPDQSERDPDNIQ